MRFGLQERIGWWPGVTIKVAPFDDDPICRLVDLTDRAPTDREWFAAMGRLRALLNSELGNFFRGNLNPSEFGNAVYAQLLRGHAVNVAAGRMRAGIFGRLNEVDKQVALFHGQQQSEFLVGFVQRLEDKAKRYWDEEKGEWKKGVINRDLQMYASRYRGSANISFEANSPDDSTFIWHLGPAEHCDDCISLAAESPHYKGELSVFPGDGGTDCKVNCKCWISRNDGVTGFPPDKGVGKWMAEEPPVAQAPDGQLLIPGEDYVPRLDEQSAKMFVKPEYKFEEFDADALDLFGELLDSPTKESIAEFFGVPSGSEVKITTNYRAVNITATHPDYTLAINRSIYKYGDKYSVAHNFLTVADAEPGTGTRIVARSLVNYEACGLVSHVSVSAAGSHDDDIWGGYYIWAALGFNLQLSEESADDISNEYGEWVYDIHGLAELDPEGWREWWKQNGMSAEGDFVPERGNRYWQLMIEYLSAKGINVGQEG